MPTRGMAVAFFRWVRNGSGLAITVNRRLQYAFRASINTNLHTVHKKHDSFFLLWLFAHTAKPDASLLSLSYVSL